MTGEILNGYLIEGGVVKKGINENSNKAAGKNKSLQCLPFTVNYYVDVCSQYGCFSSFDFSQTYNFCYNVTYETELASVEPDGGGFGSGSGEEDPTITPTDPYPAGADLHSRLGQSFENDFVNPIQANFNGQFCGYELNRLKDQLFTNYSIDILQDNISALNYPAGHPHNREYIYGFGILIGKASNPFLMDGYDYNGDIPTFDLDDPYGTVTNPGRYFEGFIKIKTCEGNDEWWISYHFYIKETI